LGVHHQTVQRCVERALAYGAMAALDDLPPAGREPTITAEAKAWIANLTCRKAKDLGYVDPSHASRAEQFREGNEQMDRQDEQIAHEGKIITPANLHKTAPGSDSY
jgi:hypothetical protein